MVPVILGNPYIDPAPGCLEGVGDLVSRSITPISHMSHSLNSLKRVYIGDYIGDYHRGY